MHRYQTCAYEHVSKRGHRTPCASLAATRDARYCSTHLFRVARELAATWTTDYRDVASIADLFALVQGNPELHETAALGYLIQNLRNLREEP